MNTRRDFRSFDFVLAILVVGLAIFGIILIASATKFTSLGISSEVRKQLIWVVTGIIIMLVVAFIDFQYICKFFVPFYGINILLLILTLIFSIFTKTIRGIPMPFGLGSIQPSEFNKIFMLIFLCRFIDEKKENINEPKVLSQIIGLTVVPFVLVMLQPSLSASMVTIVILVTMLFVGNINKKYVIGAFAIVTPILGFVYYDLTRESHLLVDKFLQVYQMNRLKIFFKLMVDPDKTYQNDQAIKAIGSGLVRGRGLFNKIVNVPEAQNDFIFSVLGEEFGFIGCMVILALLLLIILKCLIVAGKTNVFYAKLLASGIAAMLAFQVFLNVAVATNLFVNTGIALPFMSSGGSAMWVCMASIGLILNIGMTKPKSMFED